MRILSLLPSATEIVVALGAADALVGVSHECDFPAEIASLPQVTRSEVVPTSAPGVIDAEVRRVVAAGQSLYTLDEAAIRALAPEVILTQALCDVCAVLESDVRALAARLPHPPRVVTLAATTFDGVLEDIARVGAALGAVDEAAELLAGLRNRLRTVHRTLKQHSAPRPTVAMLEWTDPLFASGHWVPEIIRRAGGRDVLGTAGQHSVTLTRERIVDAQPSIVVVGPCGFSLGRAEVEARALRATLQSTCLADVDWWAIDGNALTSRPGPRVVDGVEVLARIFNPSLFSPITAGRATQVV